MNKAEWREGLSCEERDRAIESILDVRRCPHAKRLVGVCGRISPLYLCAPCSLELRTAPF